METKSQPKGTKHKMELRVLEKIKKWGRRPSPLGASEAPEQLSSATGSDVGRSLENELGSLKPWSVGEGVEHWEWGACSEGGEGEAEGAPPPMW